MIDLRSDTVTKPSREMLQAMISAPLGDDVFGDDPTTIELESFAADLFGMEAAIFCTSGTQTNQIAIKIHTQPLDEVLCDKTAHIANYESAGPAFNSGVSLQLLNGNQGIIDTSMIAENLKPDDVHMPVSRLVCLENSCNKAGGSFYRLSQISEVRAFCTRHDLKLHLDGARIFNALTASGEKTVDYGPHFDSISFCLSKGLGAPVGSLLLGSRELIKKARRIRKVLGGGMRQSGILAAAGIYALNYHISRLEEDHARAKELEDLLKTLNFVEKVKPVYTNIVIFDLIQKVQVARFLNLLKKEHGILAVGMGGQSIRFVTHLDFTEEMLSQTLKALRRLSF